MKKNIIFTSAIWAILLNVNILCAQSLTDTIFNRSADTTFAFGADISWLSQLESRGTIYKDDNGTQKDLMVILKEHGINALRFRVWVDPAGGWSGKNDVVYLSKRAHNMGFKLMIDFHYSDSWADPGKQNKPAAWKNHTIDQLKIDVYNHTYDVLDALKKNGITPAWVQIGNETKSGMLWPEGSTSTSMKNFATLINSGYNAVKAVDSTMQVIVHLPDADENKLYRWMFDGLKNNGTKWDIIGMSAYPYWAHLDWKTEIDRAVANMKDMISRYNTKVMVVETGYEWNKPYEANNFLVELMDTMKTFGGLGAFYWEPEAAFGYALGAWNPETMQPTIAMDAFLGIKHIDPSTVMNVTLQEPTSGKIYQPGENISIVANVSHLNGEIANVTFYVNNESVAEKMAEPYTYEMQHPDIGNYTIYATATGNNGAFVSSKPVTIQVGTVAILQENSDGYCGISSNAGTIDTNHANFTGTGFINTDNTTGVTVNWTVNFVETGSYKLAVRYAATSSRPGAVTINGQNIGTLPFASTGSWDTWGFSSVNYTVTKAGEVPISVTATRDEGLPNIDYMIIESIGNTSKAEASTVCLDQPGEPLFSDLNRTFESVSVYQRKDQRLVLVEASEIIDKIYLYRIDGTLVKRIDDINERVAEISCSDLNPGLYILSLSIGDKTFSRKISIIK